MIYADLESILMAEDNERQNPDEFYTNKIKNMLLVVMVINQYPLMINLVGKLLKS